MTERNSATPWRYLSQHNVTQHSETPVMLYPYRVWNRDTGKFLGYVHATGISDATDIARDWHGTPNVMVTLF